MQRLISVTLLLTLLSFHANGYAERVDPRILILGDSLSAAHNIQINQGWPHLFSLNMRAHFPHTSVINASISGETTFGGALRLPDLLQQHLPTHLIIELGGNDGLRGLNFSDSTDNLREMLALAQAQSITVLLIGVRMPPNFGPAYNQRFQEIFSTVAREYPVHYLPRFLDGVAASDPALMQADGIHPTAAAQPILADKVSKQMLEILKRPKAQ